uniref:RING-type E3 ubiquitin transferase n=1 Tax=Rhabditophanes sp. KR3021 TaxID=114890 RepID=A0AC35UC64_9BILA
MSAIESCATRQNLTLTEYDEAREPHPVITSDIKIPVGSRTLATFITCPVCLDLLKTTMTSKECLHRFCENCIILCLQRGNKECPTCRKKLPSKRSLRRDENFDALINAIFPDRKMFEDLENAANSNFDAEANYKALSKSIAEGMKAQASKKKAKPAFLSEPPNTVNSKRGRKKKEGSVCSESPMDTGDSVASQLSATSNNETVLSDSSSFTSSDSDSSLTSDDDLETIVPIVAPSVIVPEPTNPTTKANTRSTRAKRSISNSRSNPIPMEVDDIEGSPSIGSTIKESSDSPGPSALTREKNEKAIKRLLKQQIPQKSSPLLKYGLPSGHNLRYFGEFILSYDKKSRIPFWVLEYLTHDSLQKLGSTSRKNKKFMEDFYFEKHFRAYHRDYTNSTYDRGHHAAAGNHVNSDEAMKHTFFLSNIAPQVGKHFNQGIWAKLEGKIRNNLINKNYKSALVLTGPLFIPIPVIRDNKTHYQMNYKLISRGKIAVPTHYFKIILWENHNLSLEYNSFLMPNIAIYSNDIGDYETNITRIEKIAGFTVFPRLQRNLTKGFLMYDKNKLHKPVFVCVNDPTTGELLELPLMDDNSLTLTTLSHAIPGACGLKYRNKSTNTVRALLMSPTGDKFLPPHTGWTDKQFTVIFSQENRPIERCRHESSTSSFRNGDQNAKRRKLMNDEYLSDHNDSDSSNERHSLNSKTRQKRFRNESDEEGETDSPSDLIVLNLLYSTTEQDLRKHFEKYGSVTVSQIKTNPEGQSKGYGFIRMSGYKNQLKVLNCSPHKINNRKCTVKIPDSKQHDKSIEGEDKNSIVKRMFVQRITENLTPDKIRTYFNKEVKKIRPDCSVTSVYIPRPFRKFAFVEFNHDACILKLVKRNNFIIHGVSVHVAISNQNEYQNAKEQECLEIQKSSAYPEDSLETEIDALNISQSKLTSAVQETTELQFIKSNEMATILYAFGVAVVGVIAYANLPTFITIGSSVPTIGYLKQTKLKLVAKEKDILSAPVIEAKDVFAKEPSVLVMAVRRPGCLLCRKELKDLVALRPELTKKGVKLIAVVHEYAGVDQLREFFDGQIYYDQAKRFYGPKQRVMPLYIGFFRPMLWKRYFASRSVGVNGNLEGEGQILGSTFLIHKDKIIFSHLESEWGDWADLDSVREALNKIE